MKLQEYEAKKIFNKYGIKTPKSFLVDKNNYKEMATDEDVVLKSQVLVGGRGKAGGILFSSSKEEFIEKCEELFNKEIKGEKVNKILVEEKLPIKKEYYLGITIDRGEKKPVIIFSTEGGVDIEEVAKNSPEKIIKYYVNPLNNVLPYIGRTIAKDGDVPSEEIPKIGDVVYKLYKIFKDMDGILCEINPLVITENGDIYAADAVLNVDDDAYFRHNYSEFEDYCENSESFNYVELDGDIGIVGNGAGLTLATMDIIKEYGGEPACFLDIGGGADKDTVIKALYKILNRGKIKGIFINILGGITKCDEVANGIVEVFKKYPNVKFTVRLMGTNEEEGQKILKENGISFEKSMEEGAKKLMEMIKKDN